MIGAIGFAEGFKGEVCGDDGGELLCMSVINQVENLFPHEGGGCRFAQVIEHQEKYLLGLVKQGIAVIVAVGRAHIPGQVALFDEENLVEAVFNGHVPHITGGQGSFAGASGAGEETWKLGRSPALVDGLERVMGVSFGEPSLHEPAGDVLEALLVQALFLDGDEVAHVGHETGAAAVGRALVIEHPGLKLITTSRAVDGDRFSQSRKFLRVRHRVENRGYRYQALAHRFSPRWCRF